MDKSIANHAGKTMRSPVTNTDFTLNKDFFMRRALKSGEGGV
jgi:hypothetical protein